MRTKPWPIQDPIRNFTVRITAEGLATVHFREPPPVTARKALTKLPGVWQVREENAREWALATNPRYVSDQVFLNATDVLMGREPQRIRAQSQIAFLGPQECLWRNIIIFWVFLDPTIHALRERLLQAPHVAWIDDERPGNLRLWASTRIADRRKPLDGAQVLADIQRNMEK